MNEPERKIFEFGPFRIDGAERILLRDGQPVSLTLKAFDVPLLFENSGHVVEKDQLMNRVWATKPMRLGFMSISTVSLTLWIEVRNDIWTALGLRLFHFIMFADKDDRPKLIRIDPSTPRMNQAISDLDVTALP